VIRVLLLIFTLAVLGVFLVRFQPAEPGGGFAVLETETLPLSSKPYYRERFASSGLTRRVHSVTVVELSGGRLRAFWYGGSREGAKDVVIYSSVFNSDDGLWSRETSIVTRETTQAALLRYIRKIGNPVAWRDGSGRLWLFYVSVSVGGWSGSSINVMFSEDEGHTWSHPKRLVTSPFLNVSTLVKGPVISFANGTIGLPVYHEFLGKFGELLILDSEASVTGKKRLSWGRSSLQPVIVPYASLAAVGLMRYSGSSPRRILSFRTADGGIHWSAPQKTNLPNPNAAVAATRTARGDLLLVFNNSETNRENLSLAISRDVGETWQRIYTFETPTGESEGKARFAYPWLLRTEDGNYHLLYTWNRRRIKHVQFNDAWIEQLK